MSDRRYQHTFPYIDLDGERRQFTGTTSAFFRHLGRLGINQKGEKIENTGKSYLTPGRPPRRLPKHLAHFNLRLFRKKYGLTVWRLAFAMRVSKGTVQYWQNHADAMPADVVEKLVSWEKAQPPPKK